MKSSTTGIRFTKNLRIAIDVKIGSSAAGREATPGSVHAERCGVVRVYSESNHRHLAEVEQELGIGNIGCLIKKT